MSEQVQVSIDDGVMTIVLARPEKKNALTQDMYVALGVAVRAAQADPAVRCLLFRAQGDSFCAGNDIGDFARAAMSGVTDPDDMAPFQLLRAMAEFDKPAVAAVKGSAVGIGTTLLLHCDMVFVADDARLSTPFVNLALAPEAASSLLLPQSIGHVRAFSMFALGEVVDGATAAAWGLANAALPADQVDAAATEAARKLADRPLGSLQATKRLMRDGAQLWALMRREGEVFGERLRTPEAMEAFAAFSQKRAPDFRKLG